MTSTCLIAEADPFIANLLLRFAEESGLHCARARTGPELLTLIQQIHPDILIVEPELPGERRGWEVVQALRAEAEAKVKAQAEVKVEGVLTASTSALTSPLAVISCSWLEKTEVCKLIGDVAWHLQKPDLYYGDFIKALEAAGGGGSNTNK